MKVNQFLSPSIPESCPIREAVRFLAGAWTLEIYWNLSKGRLRFGELRRALQGVSPKVLTQRLRDLEDLGVIERHVLSTYPPQVAYSLTPLGLRFVPILDSIAEVGGQLTRKSKSGASAEAPARAAQASGLNSGLDLPEALLP